MDSPTLSNCLESSKQRLSESKESVGAYKPPIPSKLKIEFILNSPLYHTVDFFLATKKGGMAKDQLLDQDIVGEILEQECKEQPRSSHL